MSSREKSSIGTIPDLVNTTMQMLSLCTKMLLDRKAQDSDDKITKERSRLINDLLDEQDAVASVFNMYVVTLGTKFSSGDGKFKLLISLNKAGS